MINKTLNVALAERSYPIHIGENLLSDSKVFSPYLKSKQVAIVTNTTVASLYLNTVTSTFSESGFHVVEIILPDGEQYKNSETLNQIYDTLLEARCDRSTTLIALGGGVIGDLTGFAAATYLRGVPFIQVPTTLLSQVDSSVGGKTGINHLMGKNMIGAFYQPQAVVIDTKTLQTLPSRELSAGMAEVIKYGLIRDAVFFSWLEENMSALMSLDKDLITEAIYRSCENKAEVVAIDEKESGERALLNLGHTFGHAIENAMGYGVWLHGEAVAAGTVMASELSRKMGWLSDDDVYRIKNIFDKANLNMSPPSLGAEKYLSLMKLDKKVLEGQIRLILQTAIGASVVTGDYSEAMLNEVLSV